MLAFLLTMSDSFSTTLELELLVEYTFHKGEPEIRYFVGPDGLPTGHGDPGSDDTVDISHVYLTRANTLPGNKAKVISEDIIDFMSDAQIKGLEQQCIRDATTDDRQGDMEGDD